MVSRVAAEECSPGRKPWVEWILKKAPKGRKKCALSSANQDNIESPIRKLLDNLITSRCRNSWLDDERYPMLTCLFRIDGSKDNDEFFAAMRPSISLVYAGLDIKVGSVGWIPDLIKVTVSEQPERCTITLIELEATGSVALISCRKYLPENSNEIVAALVGYLDRAIRQCRSCADQRELDLIRLKERLSQSKELVVTTAGALRSSVDFVEELPLMDQPNLNGVLRQVKLDVREERKREFQGVLRLSAQDSKALYRTLAVLDAIIRRNHHSAAIFRAWRPKCPLRQLFSENGNSDLELRKLIVEAQSSGVTLDFEKMLIELTELWSAFSRDTADQEHIRALINSYYPIGSAIKGDDRMSSIFERALEYAPTTSH